VGNKNQDKFFFQEIYVSDVGELKHFFRRLGANWFYRGQSDYVWDLSTALERSIGAWTNESEKKNKAELINFLEKKHFDFEFKRRSPHFVDQGIIQRSDEHGTVRPYWIADRLSLMQHHGVPTRLLDFSRSPYIATYFALWKGLHNKKVAVWAIDKWWHRKVEMVLINNWCKSDKGKEEITFDGNKINVAKVLKNYMDVEYREQRHVVLHELFRTYYEAQEQANGIIQEPPKGIIRLIPHNLHTRLMAQQSLFFAPLNIKAGFMENLATCYELVPIGARVENFPPVIKFVIPPELHLQIAQDLTMMNVTGFSLMPDMEELSEWMGFTKWLKLHNFIYGDMETPPLAGTGNEAAQRKKSHSIGPIEGSHFRIELFIPNEPGSFHNVLKVLVKYHINLEFYYLVEMHDEIHRPSMDCKIPDGLVFDHEGNVVFIMSNGNNKLLVRSSKIDKCVLGKIKNMDNDKLRKWFLCKHELSLIKNAIRNRDNDSIRHTRLYSAVMATILALLIEDCLENAKLLCTPGKSCQLRDANTCVGKGTVCGMSAEELRKTPPYAYHRRHREVTFSNGDENDRKQYKELCSSCTIETTRKYISHICHWKDDLKPHQPHRGQSSGG